MKREFKIKSSTITYDALADTLSARFDDRNTSHSINVHDILIIDLSEKNKIAGLEFLDVSELFDFKKSELANINNLILKVIYNEEAQELLVKAYIEFKNEDKIDFKEIIMQPMKYEQLISN